MNKVYTFIKQIAKLRGVRIEDLHKKCCIGRTNMYYTIKGDIIPSEDVFDKLADALMLTHAEKQELAVYYKLAGESETDDATMEEVKKLVFISGEKEKISEVELSYCTAENGNERRLRSLDDVFSEICEYSRKNTSGFFFHASILDCTQLSYTCPMEKLIVLFPDNADVHMEHLISSGEEGFQDNILILKAILPLLKFQGYHCYFSNAERQPLKNDFFGQTMIIRFGNEKESHHMLLTFSTDTYSDCYLFRDDNLYKLLLKNFNSAKKDYGSTLIRDREVDFISTLALDMESDGDFFLIKPTPCYNRIPMDIYQTLFDRMEAQQFLAVYPCLGKTNGSVEEARAIIESMLGQIKKRIDLSRMHKQIDVYDKTGLEEFAKTGRFSDHYPFIPTFNKNERRRMLEHIKTGGDDGNVNFYLVDEVIAEDLIFGVSKERCVYVMFLIQEDGYLYSQCNLAHDILARVFSDFVEKYIPARLAVSEKEANSFIEYLIDTHCTE